MPHLVIPRGWLPWPKLMAIVFIFASLQIKGAAVESMISIFLSPAAES